MMSSTAILFSLFIAASVSVQFDVPPLAPASALPADCLARQMPGSRFVQVKLDVSTIVSPDFKGSFDELMIKLVTRKPSVQVADFWPRTEMYSPVTTPMAIAEDYDRIRQASMQGAGGYPGVGSATGQAYFHDNLHRKVAYEQQAPMQLLTAAGTIDRRAGVYFKFKSTPQAVLEGSRVVILTLEVPETWRGDLLEFHAVAFGRKNADSNQSNKLIGQERFLVALYSEGDHEAAQFAMAFVQQQSRLQNTAQQFAGKIEQKAYPTPIHKLGQALDIYEPLVPVDYLEQWVFGSVAHQPNPRLPVDLRVAMLDFIDSRAVIESLAAPTQNTYQQLVATRTMANRSR